MTLLPPSADQWAQMFAELSQSPEITRRDIKLLREWLSKQPHLPKHMEETRLERFLYGCKLSLERTKHMLDTYYTVRANIPEFFTNRDPLSAEIQSCIDHISYFPLPGLTSEGYRVTLFKLNSFDLDHFDFNAIVKRIVMVLDARLLEEKCLNNVMVFDLEGFSMGHFARTSPTMTIVRKGMLSIQDAFPLRLARVHYVNVPVFIEKVIAVFNPLLKEKLFKKFLFHTQGGECLKEYMPQQILPLEYGGSAGSINELNDAWRKKLNSLRDWFKEEDRTSKADESKRPMNKMIQVDQNEHLRGIDGSFRQLSLD